MARRKRKVSPHNRKRTQDAIMRAIRGKQLPEQALEQVTEPLAESVVAEALADNQLDSLVPEEALTGLDPVTNMPDYYTSSSAPLVMQPWSEQSSSGSLGAQQQSSRAKNPVNPAEPHSADAPLTDSHKAAPESAAPAQNVMGQMIGSGATPQKKAETMSERQAGELVGLYNYLRQTTQGEIPPHMAAQIAVLARLYPHLFQSLLQKKLDEPSLDKMLAFRKATEPFAMSVVTAEGAHELKTDSVDAIAASLYAMDGAQLADKQPVLRYSLPESAHRVYTDYHPQSKSYSMHTQVGVTGDDMKNQAMLILKQLKASGNKTASFNGPCKPEFVLAMLNAAREVDGITLNRDSLQGIGLSDAQVAEAQAALDQINKAKVIRGHVQDVKNDFTSGGINSGIKNDKPAPNVKIPTKHTDEDDDTYEDKKPESKKRKSNFSLERFLKRVGYTAMIGSGIYAAVAIHNFVEQRKNPKPTTGYRINVDENTARAHEDYSGFSEANIHYQTPVDFLEAQREAQTRDYINQKSQGVESVSDQLKREAADNPWQAHMDELKRTEADQKQARVPAVVKVDPVTQPQTQNALTQHAQTPLTGQTGLDALQPENPDNVKSRGALEAELAKIGKRQANLNYTQDAIDKDKAALDGEIKKAIASEKSTAKAAKFRAKMLKRIMRKNAKDVGGDLYNDGQGPNIWNRRALIR